MHLMERFQMNHQWLKALSGKGLDDEVRVPLPNGGEMNVKLLISNK